MKKETAGTFTLGRTTKVIMISGAVMQEGTAFISYKV